MIDVKTRKKIIKLWEQGESKASIQRQTGVTARAAIIRHASPSS